MRHLSSYVPMVLVLTAVFGQFASAAWARIRRRS